MYGTPPGIFGLVQTNITNSAEEKWALLDVIIQISTKWALLDVIIQISTTDGRSPI